MLIPCLLFVITLGCKTASGPIIPAISSMSAAQLTAYNDTFDVLDKDRWEFGYFIGEEERFDNFKTADLFVKDGKFTITTQKGVFSKAGVGTRFYLAGDFDVQMDCELTFLPHAGAMDQRIMFALVEKDAKLTQATLPTILFVQKEGHPAVGWSGCIVNGKLKGTFWNKIKGFKGTVRFVRTGKKVSLFVREFGKSGWKKLESCSTAGREAVFFFSVQNFTFDRKKIKADFQVTCRFDNFTINAAEEIIESDI